jgi:uncharacterized protein YuzE
MMRTSHEASLLRRHGFALHRAQGETPGTETREVATGLVVDLDAKGDVVGFDIDGASRRFDLSTLETIALPVKTTKAA